MNNWQEELGLLEQWCGVLGLQPGQFEITKPETERDAIKIRFSDPLNLEEPQYSDDEQEGEDDNEGADDDDEVEGEGDEA